MRGGACATVFVVGPAPSWLLGGVCLCAGRSESGAMAARLFMWVARVPDGASRVSP